VANPIAVAVEALAPAALAIPPAAAPEANPLRTPCVSGDIFSQPPSRTPARTNPDADFIKLECIVIWSTEPSDPDAFYKNVFVEPAVDVWEQFAPSVQKFAGSSFN
jgi:hypothetical protein